jgi:hypothetical protein
VLKCRLIWQEDANFAIKDVQLTGNQGASKRAKSEGEFKFLSCRLITF